MAKREYRVIGPRFVRGTAPGETFEAELTDFEEAALIVAGHIEAVVTHRFRRGDFTETANEEHEEVSTDG